MSSRFSPPRKEGISLETKERGEKTASDKKFSTVDGREVELANERVGGETSFGDLTCERASGKIRKAIAAVAAVAASTFGPY